MDHETTGMDPLADFDTLSLIRREQPVREVICLAEMPETYNQMKDYQRDWKARTDWGWTYSVTTSVSLWSRAQEPISDQSPKCSISIKTPDQRQRKRRRGPRAGSHSRRRSLEHICLMIDAASMHSINHSSERLGYVKAVDADSEEHEQWTAQESSEIDMIRWEHDGTVKVHVEYSLTPGYLRSIEDQVLTVGDIHDKPDAWTLAKTVQQTTTTE